MNLKTRRKSVQSQTVKLYDGTLVDTIKSSYQIFNIFFSLHWAKSLDENMRKRMKFSQKFKYRDFQADAMMRLQNR